MFKPGFGALCRSYYGWLGAQLGTVFGTSGHFLQACTT